ncbi:hypothetical protein [Spongiactinospora sp. TRM90649]|uniref:Rv1733c family protein n=1 Tax=Spongiactinospora sp. TRM90649 TaxID=3031114 RepID=UPI0023F974EE|nr:hypothetical protein [Spongiactinospora sp. TRM90649]MDF5754278.1 hypothetical protein [Spongiactinospora sp. TRM90649]
MRSWVERAARRVRLYRPDGNPLRRTVDRVESAVVAAAVTLTVASVPVGVTMGMAIHEGELAAERAGRWVTGHLVTDAPKLPWVSADGTSVPVLAPVRWREADGRVVTVRAVVPRVAKAGAAVQVWLDPAGNPVTDPPDRTRSAARAVAAGAGVPIGTAGVLLLVYAAARLELDRRRSAAWARSWEIAQRGHRTV